MKQKFHTFKGVTLEDAYRAMRKKLGEDALVIRTRSYIQGGFWGSWFGRKMVEITASSLDQESPYHSRPLSPAEKKYLASGTKVDINAMPASEPIKPNTDKIAQFQKLIRDTQERIGMVANLDETPLKSATPSGSPTMPMENEIPPVTTHTGESGNVVHADPIPLDLSKTTKSAPIPHEDLRQELAEMREMLHILSAELPGATLEPEFVHHYHMLLERGLTRKHAASLVHTASKRINLQSFKDPKIFMERLKMEMRKPIHVTGGIALQAGQRRIVALIGPTGVGKTTNLAKLAALFTVQENSRIGIITTDTYRVAATDQLNTYANIINIDMEVVHTENDMKNALKRFDDRDLVFIDTAGSSPYNDKQLLELQELLAVAKPDETHLLLNANSGVPNLLDAVKQYAILEPTGLFMTKLDETRQYGALYCLAAESGIPLSYFSTGQEVPDDIMLAHPGKLATMVIEGMQRG
jgi:flagellar biosynthesis protein FlhF